MAPEFIFADELTVYRPTGEVSLEQAVRMVADAISEARKQGVRKLLAELTNLTGYRAPTFAERYALSKEWATVSGGQMIIAVVVPEAMIDPQKIGVDVAFNRGLLAEVFTSVDEATTWLKSREEP